MRLLDEDGDWKGREHQQRRCVRRGGDGGEREIGQNEEQEANERDEALPKEGLFPVGALRRRPWLSLGLDVRVDETQGCAEDEGGGGAVGTRPRAPQRL
eukprot:6177493-Pleurochrysis_carterae.AAC.3